MKILILLCVFTLSSCETKSVFKHHSPKVIESKFLKSKQTIQNRKSLLLNVNLEQKALFFEKYIIERMHKTHKFAPKLYIDGKPGKLRMDMTALFLSALAFKYAVTKEAKDKQRILEILNSIMKADGANGLDGFIPYQVQIKEDKIICSRNDTHINVYTQLLFAYIPLLKLSDDQEITREVLKHLTLIVKHLQKTNFTLADHEGNEIDYSDLSPSRFTFQTNRQQLMLIFADLALKYKLGKNMAAIRKKLSDYGYEDDIQSMHFKFLNLEFPTHSSSWLNLSNAFIGYHIDNSQYYKTAFNNLYDRYRDEKNLLFRLMYYSMEAEKDVLKQARATLNEFPINPTDREIINSPNKELNPISDASFIKLKREIEVKKPLPIYQRPMRSFEWKLNQMRIDGNFKSNGRLNYTGIDYLVAYWMFKWLQKGTNDQI